jgi:hypothetical protein
MKNPVKLPRKLSEEPNPPRPRRASHQQVIDNLERWANSPGLQPPRMPDEKRRVSGSQASGTPALI